MNFFPNWRLTYYIYYSFKPVKSILQIPLCLLTISYTLSGATYTVTSGLTQDILDISGQAHPYSGPNLSSFVNIPYAELYRADLTGAELVRADLFSANLARADLTGANLYRANLNFTNMRGADLIGANLFGAEFYFAVLTGADLTGADLEAASFVETIEKRQGYKIACLEEIAFEQGWIGKSEILNQAEKMKNNEYGKYLLSLIDQKN